MSAIPFGSVASILNLTERREDRHGHENDGLPYVHVSSLIDTSSDRRFCPREFVLRHMERTPSHGESVPPKFQVMYEAGHALAEKAIEKFLRRSQELAPYVWGDWKCLCGRTRAVFCYKPADRRCRHCRNPVDIYCETDLRNEALHTVGHADLLFRDKNGVFVVYEFKSIDRADVTFETLEEPLGDHLVQASFYYWLLISMGYRVDKRLRILYIDRSLTQLYRTKPYKELIATRIPANRINLLGKAAKVAYQGIVKGELPDRICASMKDTRAAKCKVALSCFSRRLKTITRIPSV